MSFLSSTAGSWVQRSRRLSDPRRAVGSCTEIGDGRRRRLAFKDKYNLDAELISSISYRYKRFTRQLNRDFWGAESETAHSIYVGLYGRDTAAAIFAYATAGLSISSLILSSYMKDLDPGQLAQKYREAASDIWNISEAYLSLLTDIRDPSSSLAELRKRRDDPQTQLHKVYRSVSHTEGKAYGKAQDALKNKEDLTFTDVEIDALLPDPLKRLDPPQ